MKSIELYFSSFLYSFIDLLLFMTCRLILYWRIDSRHCLGSHIITCFRLTFTLSFNDSILDLNSLVDFSASKNSYELFLKISKLVSLFFDHLSSLSASLILLRSIFVRCFIFNFI